MCQSSADRSEKARSSDWLLHHQLLNPCRVSKQGKQQGVLLLGIWDLIEKAVVFCGRRAVGRPRRELIVFPVSTGESQLWMWNESQPPSKFSISSRLSCSDKGSGCRKVLVSAVQNKPLKGAAG